MKQFLLLCALLAFAWSTQAQFHVFKSKRASVPTDSTAFAAKPVPSHKKKHHQFLPVGSFYVLTGKVRDNNVFLWMAIRDSVIKGVIRYGKAWDSASKADSLPVYGTLEADGKLLFCSFSHDGNMMSGFSGKIMDDSVFQGNWFGIASNATATFEFFRRDSVPPGIDTVLQAVAVDGTYSYHIGDAGAAGGIIIHKAGPSVVSIDLGCASGPPDYSSAMVKSASVPFDGTTAEYSSPNKPGCRLRIRVFKDFVVIAYAHGLGQCGFGATVEGVFARNDVGGQAQPVATTTSAPRP